MYITYIAWFITKKNLAKHRLNCYNKGVMNRPLLYRGYSFCMVDARREQTMRERIGARASSLVNNAQYLPRVRACQNQVTEEEWGAIVRLAEEAENSCNYFMSILSRANFERTVLHIRRILRRSVEAMSYVARKITGATKRFMNYVGDKIADGNYSMADVVRMVELAEHKKQPDRYLIGILKRGLQ